VQERGRIVGLGKKEAAFTSKRDTEGKGHGGRMGACLAQTWKESLLGRWPLAKIHKLEKVGGGSAE